MHHRRDQALRLSYSRTKAPRGFSREFNGSGYDKYVGCEWLDQAFQWRDSLQLLQNSYFWVQILNHYNPDYSEWRNNWDDRGYATWRGLGTAWICLGYDYSDQSDIPCKWWSQVWSQPSFYLCSRIELLILWIAWLIIPNDKKGNPWRGNEKERYFWKSEKGVFHFMC